MAFAPPGARADGAAYGRRDLAVRLQHFTWEEFDAQDNRLLEESGLIIGGLYEGERFQGNFGSRIGFEVFGGSVNYDGQTQAGDKTKTDTAYFGIAGSWDLVPVTTLPSGSHLKAYLGLGSRFWMRNIRHGTTESGETALGYTEYWTSFHGRLGVGADWPVAPDTELFTDLVLRIPIFAHNTVDLGNFGAGSVTVEPDEQPAVTMRAGMRRQSLLVSVEYEALRFEASDPVRGLLQPRSEANLFSLIIGFTKAY